MNTPLIDRIGNALISARQMDLFYEMWANVRVPFGAEWDWPPRLSHEEREVRLYESMQHYFRFLSIEPRRSPFDFYPRVARQAIYRGRRI